MRGATSTRSAARSTPSPCPRSISRPNSSHRFRSATSTAATAATTKRPPIPRRSEPSEEAMTEVSAIHTQDPRGQARGTQAPRSFPLTWVRQRRTTASMDLRFTGSTCLQVPDVDDGLITWYDVTLVDDVPKRSIEVTRVAVIHAGQATCDLDE